ncbi:hypothetical protein CICLE_v10023228mg [Citrus x clementina]|uniref:Uncharacterized protein n=1 Tax=Citrus clementina TaxID=85681 RepID=V4SXP7_CITCL|nr:hypothetical protein CICLE_v10023228mg [Citrus x clementina]
MPSRGHWSQINHIRRRLIHIILILPPFNRTSNLEIAKTSDVIFIASNSISTISSLSNKYRYSKYYH